MSKFLKDFPLYDELCERIKNSSQQIELRKLCNTINNLPPDHCEIIFLLIFHHEMKENKGTRFKATPYNGKVFEGGKGIMYNMISLPPILQHIISSYIDVIS